MELFVPPVGGTKLPSPTSSVFSIITFSNVIEFRSSQVCAKVLVDKLAAIMKNKVDFVRIDSSG
jgi:hypothetical protein